MDHSSSGEIAHTKKYSPVNKHLVGTTLEYFQSCFQILQEVPLFTEVTQMFIPKSF